MSRGKLLNRAFNHAISLFGHEFTAFFTDVDCVHKLMSINRCRSLVLENQSVYYPIVWSQTRPTIGEKSEKYAGENAENYPMGGGLWRNTAYGILCLAANDFSLLGPFAEYDTWGFEDRQLFEIIKNSDLKIFRMNDEGIIHRWHPKNCSESIRRQSFMPKLFGLKTACETVRDRHEPAN